MSMASRQSDELATALRVLTQLGAVVTLPASVGSVAIRTAAARLDVSADWIRDHLEEFPNWWRLPAASCSAPMACLAKERGSGVARPCCTGGVST